MSNCESMSDRGNMSCQEREGYTRQWRMANIPLVMREDCSLDRYKFFGKTTPNFQNILFLIHFLHCVCKTPLKPSLILVIQNSCCCNNKSCRGSNGCIQPLYGCRCFLSFYTLKKKKKRRVVKPH